MPWFESAEFHWRFAADVPSRVLLYLKEPHASFVLGWSPRPSRTATEKRARTKRIRGKRREGEVPAAAAAAASVSRGGGLGDDGLGGFSTGGSAFDGLNGFRVRSARSNQRS